MRLFKVTPPKISLMLIFLFPYLGLPIAVKMLHMNYHLDLSFVLIEVFSALFITYLVSHFLERVIRKITLRKTIVTLLVEYFLLIFTVAPVYLLTINVFPDFYQAMTKFLVTLTQEKPCPPYPVNICFGMTLLDYLTLILYLSVISLLSYGLASLILHAKKKVKERKKT